MQTLRFTPVQRLALSVTAIALLAAAPAHAERAVRAGQRHRVWWSSTPTRPRTVLGVCSPSPACRPVKRSSASTCGRPPGSSTASARRGRLYLIDGAVRTAPASVGSTPLVLAGTRFGVDFNPTVDRLRIVSDAGENLRVNPDTGALVLADGALTAGFSVTAAAYTNNFAGATTTALVRSRHDRRPAAAAEPAQCRHADRRRRARHRCHPRRGVRHQRHDRHGVPGRRDRRAGPPLHGEPHHRCGGYGRHDRRWLPDGHRARPDLARRAACGA